MNSSIQTILNRLESNVESVVLGKEEVVRKTMVALLAGEHILLEDVPGVGKTLVAKALAKSIDGIFTRVQFTPDLLPTDIIGLPAAASITMGRLSSVPGQFLPMLSLGMKSIEHRHEPKVQCLRL